MAEIEKYSHHISRNTGIAPTQDPLAEPEDDGGRERHAETADDAQVPIRVRGACPAEEARRLLRRGQSEEARCRKQPLFAEEGRKLVPGVEERDEEEEGETALEDLAGDSVVGGVEEREHGGGVHGLLSRLGEPAASRRGPAVRPDHLGERPAPAHLRL